MPLGDSTAAQEQVMNVQHVSASYLATAAILICVHQGYEPVGAAEGRSG